MASLDILTRCLMLEEVGSKSFEGLSAQIPPSQLKSLAFYYEFVNYVEYFSVNIVTVQGTSFQ